MVDVKEVEDTDIIDQLREKFEADSGCKIFRGPSETLFEYLQKMCNLNQETLLCLGAVRFLIEELLRPSKALKSKGRSKRFGKKEKKI